MNSLKTFITMYTFERKEKGMEFFMEDNQMSDLNTRQTGRLVVTNANSPEILTNNIYTPAFLRQQIGKLVRVEFLIGTNNLVDRVGILEDVGASYILLRSLESNSMVYADIYSIKFVTISNSPMSNNQYYNLYGNPMF